MMKIDDIPQSSDPRRINLEGRIVVAHQAEFMPWLGFISKAAMGDIFVVLDDTQYKKEYFENRNKVRIKNGLGWTWLNLPVTSASKLPNMLDVELVNIDYNKKKILKSLFLSYQKSPFFNEIYSEIENLFLNFNSNKLIDFNCCIIKYAFKKFKVNVPVIRVSDLKKKGVQISGESSDLVLSIAKSVAGKNFVAGKSGKDYLINSKFQEEEVDLVFQHFDHPIYKQFHGQFLPYMSFVDLLFNYGDEALKILPKSNFIK